MKLTNNNKREFSMDDFEKGLMLAGLVLPGSVAELNDRQALEDYEKRLKTEKGKTYFKRVVLAAEIAFQLHNELTFGRVKFQKLVYLCEHAANMNLETHYSKQVAGPFDNKFMHSIEIEFKKHKWFEVEKINDGFFHRSVYKPLALVDTYRPYFQSYFKDDSWKIQHVIDLFKSAKTDKTEIAATLYACYLELIEHSGSFTFNDLSCKFYEWSEKKTRFDTELVQSTWEWMLEKGLASVPDR